MGRLLFVVGWILAGVVDSAMAAPLDSLWPRPGEIGGDWEVVLEAPERVSEDPDLRRWGVVARETRHYTRSRDRRVEVCSIEIWAFASEPQAEAAHREFAYPDWEIERSGALLVMLRSRRWSPAAPSTRAVFAECREMGSRVRAHARDQTPPPVRPTRP